MKNLSFGKKLMLLRKEKRITQKELADKIDTGTVNIARYETDKAMPNANALVKLSDFFGVSVDYLLKDTDAIYGFNDDDLFTKFKLVDALSDSQRDTIKAMIDGVLNRKT